MEQEHNVNVNSDLVDQEEEREALSAIYVDEFLVVSKSPVMYEFAMKLIDDKSVTIRFTLPEDYPSISLPICAIISEHISNEQAVCYVRELKEAIPFQQGEVILFRYIEWLRDILKLSDYFSGATDITSDGFLEQTMSMMENLLSFGDVEEVVRQQHEQMGEDSKVPSVNDPIIVDSEIDDTVEKVTQEVPRQVAPMKGGHSQKSSYVTHENSQLKWNGNIITGDTLVDRKSVFQAHLAMVYSQEDVEDVLKQLTLNNKIANATHNMNAWRILDIKGRVLDGRDDDGEDGASHRMMYVLEQNSITNVIVIISRWYGGIHLGPDRFKHIMHLTRLILEESGMLSSNDEKLPEKAKSKGKGSKKVKAKKKKGKGK